MNVGISVGLVVVVQRIRFQENDFKVLLLCIFEDTHVCVYSSININMTQQDLILTS